MAPSQTIVDIRSLAANLEQSTNEGDMINFLSACEAVEAAVLHQYQLSDLVSLIEEGAKELDHRGRLTYFGSQMAHDIIERLRERSQGHAGQGQLFGQANS